MLSHKTVATRFCWNNRGMDDITQNKKFIPGQVLVLRQSQDTLQHRLFVDRKFVLYLTVAVHCHILQRISLNLHMLIKVPLAVLPDGIRLRSHTIMPAWNADGNGIHSAFGEITNNFSIVHGVGTHVIMNVATDDHIHVVFIKERNPAS